MSTVPSYLLLSRHSVFYFRIVVPEVIRPLFPQREIRRSLQTRCRIFQAFASLYLNFFSVYLAVFAVRNKKPALWARAFGCLQTQAMW
ncbi:hypothetical protein BHQ29_12345 [Pseudomonas sp. LPH1]|nr:DUF6538 domain-containing protein [Pseudomonas sp. LPH1]AQZ34007.1 hypothetical protein BHQ29_12345 [Pseudomonas sp. LPH1]